jgi:AraC-like DNA-binding protein
VLDAGSPVRRFDVRSQDPEFAHQELRDAYADFVVRRQSRSSDGFRFVHSGIVAPEFMVGQVHYGMAAELDVWVPETSLIVAANAGGRIEIRTDRETVRPDIGVPLLMPSHAGWQVGMDDVTVTSFVIDLPAVRRMALSTFGSDPDQLRFTSMTPRSRALRYWLDAVQHVRRDVLDDDEVSSHRLVLAEAARTLATALLLTSPNTGLAALQSPARNGWTEPAVLRRALAYIDEHAAEDVGVDDIAGAARVGVRSLQYLFRRHRGCTPLEELRRVRMVQAHGDLQAADPSRGDTVAAIAARWGFAHAGRFSVQYREAYGRTPRDTLRS